jgi:hypothetical protein
MSRARKIKSGGMVAGFSRFGLLAEEIELIDRAAWIEERTRGDFCRIAALQRARVVVAQYDQSALVPQILEVIQADKGKDKDKRNLGEELPFEN